MKKTIITTIVTLFAFFVSLLGNFNVYALDYDSLNINYDCGDRTYFHSSYISDKLHGYAGVSSNPKGNNIIFHRVERIDDYSIKDNIIKMEKTTSSDCYFDVINIQNAPFPHYLVTGNVKSDNIGATLRLCTIRDGGGHIQHLLNVDSNGNIKGANGVKVGNISSDWTEYAVAINVSSRSAKVYIEGELKTTVSLNQNIGIINRFRFAIESGNNTGDVSFDALEIVGTEKPYTNSGYADFSPILYDDAPISAYLNGKTVFYTKNNSVFYNGVKSYPAMTLQEEEMDIYGDVIALQAGFGISADLSENGVVYNNQTYLAGRIKTENGVPLVPIKAFANEVLNKECFEDGNGIYIFSDSAVNLNIDDEIPEYRIPVEFNYNPSDIKSINWYMKYKRPSANTIKEDFNSVNQSHPRILATSNDFDYIRAQKDIEGSFMKRTCNYIITQAEDIANHSNPLAYNIPDGQRLLAVSKEMVRRMEYLGFAYQITGNQKYVNCAMNNLNAAINYPDWNPTHMLDVAEMNYAFALAYDWMYDGFTEAQRQAIYEGIRKHGLDVMQRSYYGHVPYWQQWAGKIDGFVKYKSNFNAVINGGALAAAMAFGENDEDLCFDIAEKAIRSLEYTMAGFEPDGSWIEGVGYWEYTMSYLSRGIGSLNTALGTDYGLMQSEGVRNSVLWYRSLMSKQGNNNFHDCNIYTTKYTEFQWLAKIYNDNNLAATRENALGIFGNYTIYDAIWHMEGVPATGNDYPLFSYYKGTESASSRSSFADDAMFFSSHAGAVKGYHSHADVGTFVLDALGERWACDLGSEDYNIQRGRNYYAPYRRRAEAHNVVVINPNTDDTDGGQDDYAYVSAKLAVETDDGALVEYDMTPAYSDYVDSYTRQFTTDTEASTLIVNDTISLKDESDVCWFMTTGATFEKIDNTHFTLSKNNKHIYGSIKINANGFTLYKTDCEPLLGAPELEGQNTNDGYSRIVIRNQNAPSGELSIKVTLSPDMYYGGTIGSNTVTFDNFTTNTDFTENGVSVTFRTAAGIIPIGMFQFEPAADALGNADSVLKMYPKSGTAVDSNDTERGIRTKITTSNYLEVKPSKNEVYELSFDFKWDGEQINNQPRSEIRAFLNGSNNYVVAFKVNKDGKLLQFFGQDASDCDFYFEAAAWHNVRMVVKPSTDAQHHHYWLYINDVLITESESAFYLANCSNYSSATTFKFQTFDIYTFADYTTGNGQYINPAPPAIYLDNFAEKKYSALPKIRFQNISYNVDSLTTSQNKDDINSELSAITKSGDIFFKKMEIETGSGHEASILGGYLNKDSADKCLCLYKSALPFDRTGMLQVYMMGHNDIAARDHTPKLTQGRFEDIEVHLAWDGETDEINIQGSYSMEQDGDGESDLNLLSISRNGNIYLMGTQVSGIQLTPNKWYKFNMIFHSGDAEGATDDDKNWVKLYVDGVLVQGKVVFVPKGRSNNTFYEFTTFKGFKKLRIAPTSNTGITYPSSKVYIDDITVKYTAYEPKY